MKKMTMFGPSWQLASCPLRFMECIRRPEVGKCCKIYCQDVQSLPTQGLIWPVCFSSFLDRYRLCLVVVAWGINNCGPQPMCHVRTATAVYPCIPYLFTSNDSCRSLHSCDPLVAYKGKSNATEHPVWISLRKELASGQVNMDFLIETF